jgi:TolA-binding protein
VSDFLAQNFVSLKVNVKDQRDLAKKLRVLWTPTTFAAMPDGAVLHQTIGWMPPDDFIAEFSYGLARASLEARDFETASRLLRESVARSPRHDRAPEAMYWLGVSEFRRTNGIDAAKVAWKELTEKRPESAWAGRVGWLLG